MAYDKLLLNLEQYDLLGKLVFDQFFRASFRVFFLVDLFKHEFLHGDELLIDQVLRIEVICELTATHEESFHDQEKSFLTCQFIGITQIGFEWPEEGVADNSSVCYGFFKEELW